MLFHHAGYARLGWRVHFTSSQSTNTLQVGNVLLIPDVCTFISDFGAGSWDYGQAQWFGVDLVCQLACIEAYIASLDAVQAISFD